LFLEQGISETDRNAIAAAIEADQRTET